MSDGPSQMSLPAAEAWETRSRTVLLDAANGNDTNASANADAIALACSGLSLCLQRYGAPTSEFLTVLVDPGSENGGRTIQINLGTAHTLKAQELLAAISAKLSAGPDDGPVAPAGPSIGGWRTALLLNASAASISEELRTSFDRVFAIDWGSAEPRFSGARRDGLDDNWPLEQMLAHWERLTNAIAESPDTAAVRLPVLTDEEMGSLIYAFNKPAQPVVNPRFGFELFDDQVERTPDAPAVTDDGVTISYRELWARSNRLAHYLKSLGVGPETIVGVFLKRSIDLVVAVIGLQKAGGAYLPIDPGYPRGRLEYLLSDSRVGFIITDSHLAHLLPNADVRDVRVDTEGSAIAAMDTRLPVHGLKPGNLSAVFYTSGSTGQPKGVMMLHSAQRAIDPAKRKPEDLTPGEKVLLKSATGFTLILREIFWPLQAGGHLVVVPQNADKDSARLVRALRDENVVGANFVPSMLSVVMEEPGFEECHALRLIYTVGESLSAELQRRLFRLLPRVRLFVFYGCTEAPSATFRECRPDEPYGNRVVIGQPMANRKIYLLDQNLVPVPPGVTGEIHTGGPISRGYLHRPDLTADRFIPNPFSDKPGDRFYRTGDLARWLPDGNLEFLGRADFQVQVRGIRIELGEIEAVIAAHPTVKEALVIADPRRPDQTRLIAYYTEREGKRAPVAELRGLLRRQLPEYMMPANFARLEAFPLNANGKVDRRILPAPELTVATSDALLPRTAEEVHLAGIWARVLGLNDLGVTDRFFDIGGDSMLAAKAVGLINREFGASLSLPDFYGEPTIEAVARLLAGRTSRTSHRLLLPITTGHRRPIFMANTYPFLARYVEADQPLYGMKSHWLDARFNYEHDVPAIAKDYLREMREIQLHGPYVLIGFSMGGLLALEMARQLEEAGQKLECLLLLDPTMPGSRAEEKESAVRAPATPSTADRPAPPGWLNRHRSRLRGLSTAQKLAYFWAWRRVPLHLMDKFGVKPLLVMAGRGFNALGRDIPFALRRRVARHYYNRIRQAYRPQPLQSRATVYLVNRNVRTTVALLERLFPAGLEVRILATNRHLDTMNEPHLSQWMDELKRTLAGPATSARVSFVAEEAASSSLATPDRSEADDQRQFDVVSNAEGQSSVWPMGWDLPAGWTASDLQADRKSCLAHIGRNWIDQRPASLR